MKNFQTKRSILLVTAFSFFSLCFGYMHIQAQPKDDRAPMVSARCAALDCPDNDTFLYEKNADRHAPMASTTKIMTAVIVLEESSLSQVIDIPADACGIEGSSLYLTEHEQWTVEDLLYGLMLRSANDAAVALAISVAGSTDAFAKKMNAKAEQLSLHDTHFSNPHGLDDDEHYTTARDLAILCSYALQNEVFRRIVSTVKYTAHPLAGDVRAMVNHNKLLRIYDKATGIKTGYTKRSGRCLASSAFDEGVSLICVTLSAPDDWNDHVSLFQFGFSAIERQHPAE